MLLSIIIINYNTFQITADCIDSIIRHTAAVPYEIILVDNASTECRAEEFLSLFPTLTLIKNPENNGFAKGNNLGIAHAKGDVILLLNSDTLLEEDSISLAANFLKHHADIGVLGVSLKYPNGKVQHYTRRFRTISNELLDLVRPLLFLMPYRKRAVLMLNQYYDGDFDTEADWIGGAFFMIPRKVIHDLPGRKLDDRFFMYGEDQLWCYQIHQLGYRIFNYSRTSVIHIENASSNSAKLPKFKREILERDLLVYKLQGYPNWKYNVLKCIFYAKKYVAYCLKLGIYKLRNRK